jgi:hypothetical protein
MLMRRLALISALVLVVIFNAFAQGTNGLRKPDDIASGRGIMVAGELWDSFMPMNKGPYYGEGARSYITTLVRIGNFDRQWSTPTHMWPGGRAFGNYWNKGIEMAEWNPSLAFNPQTIDGKTNPLFNSGSGPNYCLAAYGNPTAAAGLKVPGQGNPTRDYAIETKFVDASRHHAMYEAGWPTNIGVDVKMKVHQWTLNWNNFNDFILMEFTLTNTGKKDINLDGISEDTANVIHALTFLMHGEFMCSYELSASGGRTNRLGAQRAIGYVGNNDPLGQPVDMMVGFPGESSVGMEDMGLNAFGLRWYTDVWSGWAWLGALTANGDDKATIFGTHPIGTGSQRGWYTTAGQGKGFPIADGSSSTPDHRRFHIASMGVWYKDGGKSRDTTKMDLSPDPNFFQSGTPGNPETFVPKASPDRPGGDRKLLSLEASGAFEVNPYEPEWTKGFVAATNFDGEGFSSIGPFHLEVGESITITLVEVGGYRMEGIKNALAAARWAYSLRRNNYAAFDSVIAYPQLPEMCVDQTLAQTMKIRWDDKAETIGGPSRGDNFAGYKIYRCASSKSIDWFAGGMQGVDNYWQNMTPGTTPLALLKPANPYLFSWSVPGTPESWGPYELMKVITKASVGLNKDTTVAGYSYSWDDSSVALGVKYWYYVSAFTNEATPVDLGTSYSGMNPRTTTSLETSNMNRNGATGLWAGTYPFAFLNAYFPTTREGLIRIGAPTQVLRPVTFDSLLFGSVNVGTHRDCQIRLRNSSDDTMQATVALTNSAFNSSVPTLSVPPRDSVVATIRFSPVRVGLDTGHCLVTIPGAPTSYTVSLTGTGTSGTQALNLAWENVDAVPTYMPSGPCVAVDGNGGVYSALMRYPPFIWEIRKHGPAGGVQWSVSDTAYGPSPTAVGLMLDSSGNLNLGLSGSPSSSVYRGSMTVVKVSSSGQPLWTQSLAMPTNPILVMNGFTVDAAGNAYATGYSIANLNGTNSSMTTAKFNSDGSFGWLALRDGTPLGSDSADVGRAVAVDSSGNVFVTGETGTNGNKDIVTLKYKSMGQLQWASTYQASTGSPDDAKGIAITPTGDVFVLGQTTGSYADEDIVVLMYRGTDGALVWSDQYDAGAHLNETASSLLILGDGRIMVSGYTMVQNSTFDGIVLEYTDPGFRRYLLFRKLLLQYKGTVHSNNILNTLASDHEGNTFIGGYSTGSLGNMEAVLLKFAPDDNLTWETHYSPAYAGNVTVSSLAAKNDGGVAIAGFINGTGSPYHLYVASFGERPVAVTPQAGVVPSTWAMFQNYPNPFNPRATIRYQIASVSQVHLVVYDILGREMATLVNEKKGPGTYESQFDGSRFASGVYFYRLTAGRFVQVRKMLLLK